MPTLPARPIIWAFSTSRLRHVFSSMTPFLADVADAVRDANWNQDQQRARGRLAEPLLSVRRFISRNGGSLVLQFKQRPGTQADARFENKIITIF
jgi:propionate catabolism operon transcriptional regulator